MRTRFRGKSYEVKLVHKMPAKMRKAWAYCTEPSVKGNGLVFKDRLWTSKRSQLLETLIHESLHACFWDLSEYAVAQSAVDIARFLKKMGVVVKGNS